MRLAGVRIGSEDLTAAIRAYELLLRIPGSPLAGGGMRFRLGRDEWAPSRCDDIELVGGEGVRDLLAIDLP